MLEAPAARHPYWRARFKEPFTGRVKKVRLDPVDLTTAELRKDWAIKKSRELARTRMDIALGAPVPDRSPLEEAVKEYREAAKNRLRATTIGFYEGAHDIFLAWAQREGLERSDQLTAQKLPRFRDHLLAQRKQAYVTGGGRGERKAGTKKLSPQTINGQLRAVKTLLNDLRLRGTVRLSSDEISDGLKLVPVPREAPEFLSTPECAQLLEAARRHDADTFDLTRDENEVVREMQRAGVSEADAKKAIAGRTLRYEPIAPFVLFVLLTGMRLSEALALRWERVDLRAINGDGKAVGEIRLRAEDTKTKIARTVALEFSPSLLAMLASMKLRAGTQRFVFGGSKAMPKTSAEASRRRLVESYGAPANFTWQILRSTCATYGCNAPNVYGGGAAFVSAKRLGHSITVSEKHYAGLVAVSRRAKTLEQAMQVEAVAEKVASGQVVEEAARGRVA